MKLKDFQEQIFAYLEGSIEAPCKFVQESKGIPRHVRLDSYRESFRSRIRQMIKKDFAVTQIFLGLENFDDFVDGYFSQHPSRTHYINELGRHFPNYIRNNRPPEAAPFITELADLEWLMVKSFYNYFNLEKDTENGEQGTQIEVNPSLTLLKSAWPLDVIWNEEKSQDEHPSFLSVWTMPDRFMRIRNWSELEYSVLSAFLGVSSIEQAIEKIDSSIPTHQVETVLTATLPQWIQLGIMRPHSD